MDKDNTWKIMMHAVSIICIALVAAAIWIGSCRYIVDTTTKRVIVAMTVQNELYYSKLHDENRGLAYGMASGHGEIEQRENIIGSYLDWFKRRVEANKNTCM